MKNQALTSDERPEVPGLLSSLWTKYLPLMRERLALLEVAADAAGRGEMSADQRAAAIDAAHKFAGSLGMFGFAEGTDAARSIEHLLLGADPLGRADEARTLALLVGRLHAVLDL